MSGFKQEVIGPDLRFEILLWLLPRSLDYTGREGSREEDLLVKLIHVPALDVGGLVWASGS